METVFFAGNFGAWRQAARSLLAQGGQPEDYVWQPRGENLPYQGGLFDGLAFEGPPIARATPQLKVPREFIDRAERVSFHRDPGKWQLLYRLLWRIVHENAQLLDVRIDEDVREFFAMEHAVRRDAHKMKAFVRFRKLIDEEGCERFIAWHEPDHPLLRHVAAFFQDRFSILNWTIMTPDESVSWDGQKLNWGPGRPQSAAPRGDDLEDLWKCYYSSIFNPARLKIKAMRNEMPVRYWKSLPETQLIDELISTSADRVEAMIKAAPKTATPFLPEQATRESLALALQKCTACPLCETATQAVFSEGPITARVMIIGEQPGDQEDRSGRPFIGPAGELLDRALEEAGLQRGELYLTNAVKHFKHRIEGPRRIHVRPSAREVAACKPWLGEEIRLVQPAFVVCLGMSSALAVFGQNLRLHEVRGKIVKTAAADRTLVTYHPAFILRISDPDEKARAYRQLVADLSLACESTQA